MNYRKFLFQYNVKGF